MNWLWDQIRVMVRERTCLKPLSEEDVEILIPGFVKALREQLVGMDVVPGDELVATMRIKRGKLELEQ